MKIKECKTGRKAVWKGNDVKILQAYGRRVRCTVLESGNKIEVRASELERKQVGRPPSAPGETMCGALGYVRVPQWAEAEIRKIAKRRKASVAGVARSLILESLERRTR